MTAASRSEAEVRSANLRSRELRNEIVGALNSRFQLTTRITRLRARALQCAASKAVARSVGRPRDGSHTRGEKRAAALSPGLEHRVEHPVVGHTDRRVRLHRLPLAILLV